jgi:F0F1-type ATP synthase membrane subunit b/b'
MSTQEPGRIAPPALTSLPRLEDIPVTAEGYDQQRVREAFEAFRRHVLQLQAQLRVLQAAGGSSRVEATAHAVRMDALHLIRGAAEFADALERDAQRASAAQLARTEEEVRRRQLELQGREAEVERFRADSERQRADILNAARNEARELLANAHRDATAEVREAEARGARLLEQSRHQATELTNAARAEVEQTLEWARAQASTIIARAQQGAEQLLGAAGLGADEMQRVVDSILRSAEASAEAARAGLAPQRPAERPPSGPVGLVVADEPAAEETSAPADTASADTERAEPEPAPAGRHEDAPQGDDLAPSAGPPPPLPETPEPPPPPPPPSPGPPPPQPDAEAAQPDRRDDD